MIRTDSRQERTGFPERHHSIMSTDENTTPLTPEQLAQRAMVAYRVKEFFADLCDPHIAANAEYIEQTPGLRSTTASVDGGRLAVTFTESRRKPSFYVEDEDAFVQYADEKGEARFVANPAFEKAVLKRAEWNAELETAVDKVTGEVLPGIGYKPGGDFISVKPSWTEGGLEYVDGVLAAVLGGAAKALPMIAPADEEPEDTPEPVRER